MTNEERARELCAILGQRYPEQLFDTIVAALDEAERRGAEKVVDIALNMPFFYGPTIAEIALKRIREGKL